MDVAFITGLLVFAGVPLIALRGSPWWHRAPVIWGYWAVGVVVTVLWKVVHRRLCQPGAATTADEPPHEGRVEAADRIRTAIQVALLLGLTLVTFADPLRRHFWGGFDEASSLSSERVVFWSDQADETQSRPLAHVSALLGRALTPDRVEGFLWVAVALCFLNSLLLMAVIRRVLPGGALAAVAAAALFIANRAEPLRFFPLWTTNYYWLALFCGLLGLWLLLVSHDRQSRGWLAASCVSLGAGALMYESLYPLALLGPLLLWLRGARGPRLWTWSYAWLGTLGLLALRFAAFFWLAGSGAYQARYLATTGGWAGALSSLGARVAPLFTYLEPPGSLREYEVSWLLALVIGMAALGLAVTPLPSPGLRRGYVVGLGVAALAILLGIAPFVLLPGQWRTQYFAGPGQAALVAIALALLGSLLPGRPGQWLVVATTAILAANATAGSLQSQDAAGALVRFEKTAHVFRQVHGVAPRLAADTLVLFVLDDGSPTPLGVNYHVCQLSREVLGALAVQANFADPHNQGARFGSGAVAIRCRAKEYAYPYERVVAFRLAVDGTVSLLSRLPAALAPWEHVADRYRPLARLAPGPIDEPRYLRYPAWSERPLDVLDTEDGVLLGANWGELEREGRAVFRWADPDAEIVVNPIGRARRQIALDAEPAGDLTGRPGHLRVLDEAGRVVASARLGGGRQLVRMTLPLDPGRVALFRLQVEPDGPPGSDPSGGSLRIWRSDGGTRAHQRRGEGAADIVGDDARLRLGRNWYPLEQYEGETFRWFDNDAEIVVNHLPRGPVTLELELAPGPGLGWGQPCRLSVQNQSGQTLARATAGERTTLRLPLTITAQPDAIFRLHVDGGGESTPGDPRILNCRVFSVRRPRS